MSEITRFCAFKSRLAIAMAACLFFTNNVLAQPSGQAGDTSKFDLKKFAENIVKDSPGNFEKAATLLKWLSSNFQWLSTDYKTRTVDEIIARKGGNCFELAITYMAMIKELNINYRPIAEINLYTTSERRKLTAEKLVKEKGNEFSVFGGQHNDHRWVEIYDDRINEWIPVDPTMCLIGFDQWERARAWFGERHTINDEISSEMIAPIAIFVVDPSDKHHMLEDRTQTYMVTHLNQLYQNKLAKLPSWSDWKEELTTFASHAKGAFEGKENLHNYTNDISRLLNTYNKLKTEYNQ